MAPSHHRYPALQTARQSRRRRPSSHRVRQEPHSARSTTRLLGTRTRSRYRDLRRTVIAKRPRVSLSDLARPLAEELAADIAGESKPNAEGILLSAPLSDLTPNPRNPRDAITDLSDLASIADIQLQPANVITAAAYHNLYPDDEITTPYVIINGCRRFAAATHYGRPTLDIVIKDELATDRPTLITNAIRENIERLGLDILEEARAVNELAVETGSGKAAAHQLGKTEGWVSQRRALLQLHPDLQQKLREGELAIRDARALATVPLKLQVDKWLAHRDQSTTPKPTKKNPNKPQWKTQRAITAALGTFHQQPNQLAGALRTALGDDGIDLLIAELTKNRHT
jgi:ParB family chromosome partitioning protein